MKRPTIRVVVDGSNLATEGRTIPSLIQLDDAVRAFLEEYDHADVIVVVDASFEHRVAAAERARFKEAEIAGEIVTPPAGAVGRGDAFILKIAQRIDAVVLSNDSFQEFHEQYPWLFDTGRLIGGKPVKGVGWVFTERIPVRGVKSVRATRAAKKLAVELPEGVVPAIGDTLTPVKAARAVKRPAAKAVEAQKSVAAAKAVRKSTAGPKEPRETTSAARGARKEPAQDGAPDSPHASEPRAAKSSRTAKATTEAGASRARTPKVALESPEVKASRVPKKSTAKRADPGAAVTADSDSTSLPAVALRRGRQAVNPEDGFTAFVKLFKVGATMPGEVVAFTSHGAVIKVVLKDGSAIECYAPTTSLGDPAPARARDAFKRGDQRNFRLVTVDGARRIAELALA